MKTWILVIFFAAGSWRGGVSVDHVPGFATQASCVQAGTQLVRKKHKDQVISFQCIEQTGAK